MSSSSSGSKLLRREARVGVRVTLKRQEAVSTEMRAAGVGGGRTEGAAVTVEVSDVGAGMDGEETMSDGIVDGGMEVMSDGGDDSMTDVVEAEVDGSGKTSECERT